MFSWELFTVSQKEILSDICTEWNDSQFLVHQMAWVTFDHPCKKAQNNAKRLERKYYTNNLCIINAVQICHSSIHHFKYFWETEVEILVLGCERKHDLIHQCKVNKAHKFVLYMSEQSINFKNAETS